MASFITSYGFNNAWPDQVSDMATTQKYALGTIRVDNGCEYIYCKNQSSSVAIKDGYGVAMYGSTSPAYEVEVASAAGQFVVGFVWYDDVPASTYFWALRKGITPAGLTHTGLIVEGTLTADATCAISAAGGVCATVSAGFKPIGVAIESGSTDQYKKVWVNV